MSLARVKTWNPGDTLTAADLNAEFNNILNNPRSLINSMPGAAGDVWVASGTNAWASVSIGSTGQVLMVSTGGLPAWANLGALGQCRLVGVSSSTIALIPYHGNLVPVKSTAGWTLSPITSTSGVTLSSTGFVNLSSMNYLYTFLSSGSLTLVAMTSSFPHSASSETGVEVLTTDATRTLVGMIQTSTAAAGFFSTGGVGNLVASWYNRHPATVVAGYTANRTVATTSFTEPATESRVQFLCWSTELPRTSIQGAAFVSAGAGFLAIAYDGVTPEDAQASIANATVRDAFGCSAVKSGLTDGSHFATLVAATDAVTSTLTILGGAAPTAAGGTSRTSLNVEVRV